MTKLEAERQLERVKFLRELAQFDRGLAERLEQRATELEIEALEALTALWPQEQTK